VKTSGPLYASFWLRIRSGLIVALLTVAITHTGHSRLAQVAPQEILAGASSKSTSRTVPSHDRRSAVPGLSQPDAGTKARIAEAYGRQPLGFEANRGQTDAGVQFVSRGAGYTLFLTSTQAVLALRRASPETTERTVTTPLRMKLVDSNPAPRVSQADELPGKSNYIIGSDHRNWHTQVPRYGKVKYEDVYPGVDLVYYGNQQQLEYDFIVSPGADPDVIELAFEGAQSLRVDDAGDLLLDIGDGEVRLKTPLIYQETDGRRVQIPGGYRKTGSDRVAFHLGAYDSTRPLVVDPIVFYSTYLGGSGQDFALGIATDHRSAVYITGYTSSVNFPTSGAPQPACAASGVDGQCEDAFITVLGPNGTFGYSTYIGGTFADVATGIAVRDDTGEIYIAGWTRSPDFPTANAIDAVFGDSSERAFAAKLSSDGSELASSTFLGVEDRSLIDSYAGPSVARANGIAVDSDGAAYVTGSARGYYGLSDVFVTKLTADGSSLAYVVRFGSWDDDVAYGIAVDGQGYASVTGATYSPDFPRVGSSRPASDVQPLADGSRGFAAKLVPDGSAFVYSTYLFGVGTGLAVAGPNTYITGVLPQPGASTDAFVAVLGFDGNVSNFRIFGGSGEDRGSAIGVDWFGMVWVTGVTASTDFPLINPLQGQVHGVDAFVMRLAYWTLEPFFSTYLGGSGREQLMSEIGNSYLPGPPPGPALAADRFGYLFRSPNQNYPLGLAYVAGFTDSTDFPTAGYFPSTQPTKNGPVNSFVAAIIDDGVPTKPDLVVTEIGRSWGAPAEADLGDTLYYVFQVTNKGPARARDVVFFDKLPPGVIVNRVLWQPLVRNCAHDASLVFCDLGALAEGESVIINIDVTPTTVGAQIDTAAVIDASSWLCPTCISTPFVRWIYGFDQDLIWGADADLDADIHDNTVTTTKVITPGSADLSVTGSASSDVVVLDGTITYTLDVENHGPSTTAATLSDTLPAGTTLISATQTGDWSRGGCTGTTVITCQWWALSPSSVGRLTIVVRATSTGTLTNTAVVSSIGTDPNSANNTVTLATRVNRPPTANAGPDQIVSAGTNCQTMVAFNGTASSDPDGDTLTFAWTIDNLLPPPILLSPTDPSVGTVTGPTPTGPLPLGAHTITLTVNDGHGGTASDTVVVTVRDVTAPAFSGVPAPMTIEQSSQSGASFSVSIPTAADNCSGSVVVSSNAPAAFPPGPTTVTFTARDAAGNNATAATTVTVVDTTPPTFSGVPPPITVEQTGPSGTSLVVPKPTANDSVSGAVTVSSNAPAMFPPGVNTVTFTARDAAGNTAITATTVTVVDTVSPALAIASPQARAYLHPDVVIMSFSATDAGSGLAAGMPTAALDGTTVANGQSVNTLTLALGTHNFVLSAVDVAGNSRSQNVAFTVIATIDSLIASVNVFAGQQKIDDSNTVKSLLAKLNDAKQAAERGNKTAAIHKLAEFIDLVRNQSGRHIASDAAQILVSDAQYVIGTLP
jgi:uncharacterized repeat protein (TIGR01451 family)